MKNGKLPEGIEVDRIGERWYVRIPEREGIGKRRIVRKLRRVLADDRPLRLVVERRDRLTRFGFDLLWSSLTGRGSEVVVVDEDDHADDDIVRDMTEVLTSLCARVYGKQSAKRTSWTCTGWTRHSRFLCGARRN